MTNLELDTIHFQTLVVGDLTRDEAYRFYLSLLEKLPEDESVLFDKTEEYFASSVFYLTGGRVLVIKRFIIQTLSENEVPTSECQLSHSLL